MSMFRRLVLAGAAVVAWRYFADDVAGADRRRTWSDRLRAAFAAVIPSSAPPRRGPRQPLPPADDAIVDEASEDSFPASDPPAFWGRESR